MPTYDYLCMTCEKHQEIVLPIADRDKPCEQPCECGGTIERVLLGAPVISYTYGGPKTPETFKDVLRKIKKNHIRNTINV